MANRAPDALLGADQWKWLETQLAGSTASVHIFVSSIQVTPDSFVFVFLLIFIYLQPSRPARRDQHVSLLAKSDVLQNFIGVLDQPLGGKLGAFSCGA